MQVLWAAAVLIDIIFWLLFDWCRLSHLYFTCFLTDFLLCKYCKNGTSSTVFFKCYCHFLVFQCICSKRTVVLNRHSDSVVMKTEFALNLFAAWSRFYLCIGIPFYKWFTVWLSTAVDAAPNTKLSSQKSLMPWIRWR